MNIFFFASLLSMLLAAAAFVACPFFGAAAQREAGFAKLHLLVALVLISASVALYAVLGRPDLAAGRAADASKGNPAPRSAPVAMPDRNKAGTVESLLGGLEARLEQDPGDGKGWLLLAKSYDHLGRTGEAAEAYAKARALGQADAAFEAGLAAGMTGPRASIAGRVSLTDRARAQLSPGDTVFIIARSADGNPMPLAVLRQTAGELPFDFTLDDSHSMVKGRGISDSGRLTVTAKVSSTGDALAASTGLSAPSLEIDVADVAPVELLIDVTKSATD